MIWLGNMMSEAVRRPKAGPVLPSAKADLRPRAPTLPLPKGRGEESGAGIPFHPLADIFPLMEGAAFDELVQGIREDGFRMGEEIVLLDGMILDGRNRYRAAVAAGLFPADVNPKTRWEFVVFSSGDGMDGVFPQHEVEQGPLAFVIAKNVHRRHLDESQRAMVASKIETLKHGQRKDLAEDGSAGDRQANLPVVSRGEAAKLMNVSPRSVTSAAVVRDHAEPELRQAVERGQLAVSAAAKASTLAPEQQREIAVAAGEGRSNAVATVIKQGARSAREALLGARIRALPEAKFGVILADPEWDRTVYSNVTGMNKHAANHYPVSSDEVIAARDVASIAAEDCVLGLWCTETWRGEAVLRAWGFEPKADFVWVKDIVEVSIDGVLAAAGIAAAAAPTPSLPLKKGESDTPRRLLSVIGNAGTGFWNRDRHETLLIGTKGKPPCPAPGTQGDSVWFAARPRDAEGKVIHSAKPECCVEWFEKHFPSVPKIELNRRGAARPGWSAWGNEVVGAAAE